MTATKCSVCAIEWGRRQQCQSPSCPCYGTRCGTAEMEAAAAHWRSRPSVAASRSMTGQDAVDVLERDAWLAFLSAAGELYDLEDT